jgi:hypothetical protein
MSGAKLVFTGDSKSAEAAIARLENKEAKLTSQIARLTKQVKQQSSEFKAGTRQQIGDSKKLEAALKSLESPAKKHRDTVKSYQAALASGAVTQAEYTRLVAKATSEFQEARAEADGSAAAIRRMNAAGERIRQSILTPSEKVNVELRELKALRKQNILDEGEYQRAVAKTLRTQAGSTDAIKDQEAGLSGLIGSVGKLAAGWLSVSSLVQLATAEVEKHKRINRSAAEAATAQAAALESLNVNFTGDASIGNATDLDKELRAIAARTGSKFGVVAEVAGSAFSAKGSLTNKEALTTIENTLRLKPDDAGFGATVAGSALDLQNLTGMRDSQAAIGFLAQVQKYSRVVDPKLLAKPLAQSISAVTAAGGSAEFGGELFAALSGASTDVTGETTRTEITNLVNQLTNFVPKLEQLNKRGETVSLDQATIDRFNQADSPQARIEAIQGSESLADAFIAKSTFSAGTGTAVKKLLRNDANTLANFMNIQGGITSVAAAKETFSAKVRQRESAPGAELLVSTRAEANEKERRKASLARLGRAREVFDAALDDTDLFGPDSVVKLSYDLTAPTGTAETAAETMHALIDRLEVQKGNLENHFPFEGNPAGQRTLQAGIDNISKLIHAQNVADTGGVSKRSTEVMEKQIKVSEQLIKSLDANTRAQPMPRQPPTVVIDRNKHTEGR